MERPFDAGAVIAAELADARDHIREILRRHLAVRELLLAAGEPRLRDAPEIHDDLEDAVEALERADPLAEVGGKGIEDRVEVVTLDRRHLTTTRATAGSSMRTPTSLPTSIPLPL